MPPFAGFTMETATFAGYNGDQTEAAFAYPLGDGPFPGVVVIHHNPGWDEQIKMFTAQVAFHGYMAFCPNLYYREAPDASPDDAAAAARNTNGGGITDDQAVGDIAGAVAFLRAHPKSNGKVGTVGYCSGGRLAFLSGCKLQVDAIVDFHGGNVIQPDDAITPRQPVSPITLAANLSAPLLGLFGADDQNPSVKQTAAISEELDRLGKPHEFHTYEGAGHSFTNWGRPAYKVEQALEANEEMFAFFAKNLSA